VSANIHAKSGVEKPELYHQTVIQKTYIATLSEGMVDKNIVSKDNVRVEKTNI